MTARKGTRNPALLVETKPRPAADSPGFETYYVVARKPMRHRGELLQPGAEIPGAAGWSRLESWVSMRLIEARTRSCETGPAKEVTVEALQTEVPTDDPPEVPPEE